MEGGMVGKLVTSHTQNRGNHREQTIFVDGQGGFKIGWGFFWKNTPPPLPSEKFKVKVNMRCGCECLRSFLAVLWISMQIFTTVTTTTTMTGSNNSSSYNTWAWNKRLGVSTCWEKKSSGVILKQHLTLSWCFVLHHLNSCPNLHWNSCQQMAHIYISEENWRPFFDALNGERQRKKKMKWGLASSLLFKIMNECECWGSIIDTCS